MPDPSANNSPLGLFGGTFDPIHLGHTSTVRELMTLSGVDEVRFIPAAVPPHRDQPAASPEHRLAMARLATASMNNVCVDERELLRRGPSYTVDTVAAIREENPGRPLCLITGMDALLGLPDWHRWQLLLDMVGVLVMVRPGYQPPKPLPEWWRPDPGDAPGAETGKIRLVPVAPNPISATRVRAAIECGGSPQSLLHPDVWRYIQSHRLYHFSDLQPASPA